ncbi:hypothetical protein GCM10018785_70800 [Streptomyces longispororuber]|uniref:Uncharacterized protein n=1 Tax=Streptomyces longispororuber TaxID=68230 RepID=A0A919A9K2_9ACTN|nr:hypothetical protein GCM10018785_70800 [Streptomyces longispororuber]
MGGREKKPRKTAEAHAWPTPHGANAPYPHGSGHTPQAAATPPSSGGGRQVDPGVDPGPAGPHHPLRPPARPGGSLTADLS